MSKYKCPNCGSERFSASAHVVQDWEIDGDGKFVREIESCVEITHFPDKDDLWDCIKCGHSAAGEDFAKAAMIIKATKIN